MLLMNLANRDARFNKCFSKLFSGGIFLGKNTVKPVYTINGYIKLCPMPIYGIEYLWLLCEYQFHVPTPMSKRHYISLTDPLFLQSTPIFFHTIFPSCILVHVSTINSFYRDLFFSFCESCIITISFWLHR